MINAMTIIKKKETLSYLDFQAYWRKEHANIVTRSPDIGTYVQSHPIYKNHLEFDGDIDGLAEIWFEDTAAMRKLAATEEYRAIQEDEKVFIDSKSVRLIIAEDTLTINGAVTDRKILLFTKKPSIVDLNVFRDKSLKLNFNDLRHIISRSKVSLPKTGGYKNGKVPEWDAIFTFWVEEDVSQKTISTLIAGVSDLSSKTIGKYCQSILIKKNN